MFLAGYSIIAQHVKPLVHACILATEPAWWAPAAVTLNIINNTAAEPIMLSQDRTPLVCWHIVFQAAFFAESGKYAASAATAPAHTP